MPAERTRGRRNFPDATHLGATSAEPSTAGIAFATNLTPVTFNDLPPLVDAPCESILFPNDCQPASRSGHTKKKPENHIPRPPNAFILFRSSFIKSQHVSTEVETNHSTLSKIIGLTWKNLCDEEREVWYSKAKTALEEHRRKFPDYSFRPLHSRSKGGTEKRRTREVEPTDLKRCAKIAELLVEGVKGQELDAAIQEFDKNHVPEVITRFEAPLTARMYRRSSSAPVPDTAPPARKPRASSTHPTRHPTPAPPSSSSLREKPGLQRVTPDTCDEFYDTPSFDPYLFTPKQEPSFDFNTFSFNNIGVPLPIFECDPLSAPCDSPTNPSTIFSPEPENRAIFSTAAPSQGLSVHTSFIDEWVRSSSPSSSSTNNSMPATPYYVDCPSPPDPYRQPCGGDSNLCSFDQHTFMKSFEQHPLSKSFDEHSLTKSLESFSASSNFPVHSIEGTFKEDNTYPTISPFDLVLFGLDHPTTEVENLDLEFSAFMATLPQYS